MYHLNVRDARKKLNLSLQDLSAMSGVPRATLSKIERNFHNPTVRTLEMIANAMPSEAETLIVWRI